MVAAVEGTPFLLPVGSLTGAGENGVFDLDGNATEWAVRSEGEGKPIGPWAGGASDARSETLPSSAYIDLRVVVGPPSE